MCTEPLSIDYADYDLSADALFYSMWRTRPANDRHRWMTAKYKQFLLGLQKIKNVSGT